MPASGTALAIVDAAPLYAVADADDADHAAFVATLSRPDLRLVIPALVVAEATYFVGERLGAPAPSRRSSAGWSTSRSRGPRRTI